MVVSEDDDPEIVDSLNEDGLLSPVIDQWRLEYLSQYASWFSASRELNKVAMKLWLAHWRSSDGLSVKALLPTAARVFGRGINNFTASVILCERGSAIEAASLARSIAEASFWLAYMAKEPIDALSALEADDIHNFIQREQELRRVSVHQTDIINQSMANEALYREQLALRPKPSIAKIAKEHGTANGYLKYRIMSGFYSHLSEASLRHHVLKTGEKTGLNILGPHSTEIPKALYFAGDSLIDCAAAFCVITNDHSHSEALEKAGMVLHTLRNDLSR